MSIKVKVDVNYRGIQQRLDTFKGRLYASVKTQIYKGSIPFTPYLTGELQTSAYPSSIDTTRYLVYNVEYARYQYYANGLAPQDFAGRTKDTHPLASCLWVEKYLGQGGKQDIQAICDVAPQVLRF